MSTWTETVLSGPVLEGSGPRIVDIFVQVMTDDLGDEGVRRVRERLGRVLKHPTGYYSSRIVKTTRMDEADVTDSRVVYGPWLEGIGSRNQQTRFKGYRTFQITSQLLDSTAEQFLQRDIARMSVVLGGN